MADELHLFFDDSGPRNPDHEPEEARRDNMDCFAFGGVLVREEDAKAVGKAHKAFCAAWGITYPLHSSEIRGPREKFDWVGTLSKVERDRFYNELGSFLCDQPVWGIAAIIDRPGYRDRYKPVYGEATWRMDKTAFVVLVERAAYFARSMDRKLRVHFEGAGERENKAIIQFQRDLKKDGMPFGGADAKKYEGLTAEQFRETLISDPERQTKQKVLMQVADLYLYAMAKSAYDPNYPPFQQLLQCLRIIHCTEAAEMQARYGIKYSCFPKVEA